MSITSRSDNPQGGITGTDHASLKVNTPNTYHGDRHKLQTFLAQCNMYIHFNVSKLGSAEVKVMFATTYLRNGAFNWFKPYLTDYIDNAIEDKKNEIKAIFSSYKHFKKAIQKVYEAVNEK
jgi:Domain of unknown function (DUF4939)